jgi:hypothetical protein
MKITNKTNLPQAFVDFARSDKYSKGQSDISVTSLIDSPKVRIMKEHFHDDMEVDAVDMVWALFGTAVHAILETSKQTENIVTEERLYTKVDDWILSGAIDRQEIDDDGVSIYDYKVTSVWSLIFDKPEWERQLNCYAYLVEKEKGIKVKDINICVIARDWNRRKAEQDPSMPPSPIQIKKIPLWSFERRARYIQERVALHQQAQITFDLEENFGECTDDDRWKKSDTWAVKKSGQKRALRVFNNEKDANEYVEWHNETDKSYVNKSNLEIEIRSGEYTRCKGNYCSVAEFCNQYKGDNYGEQKERA